MSDDWKVTAQSLMTSLDEARDEIVALKEQVAVLTDAHKSPDRLVALTRYQEAKGTAAEVESLRASLATKEKQIVALGRECNTAENAEGFARKEWSRYAAALENEQAARAEQGKAADALLAGLRAQLAAAKERIDNALDTYHQTHASDFGRSNSMASRLTGTNLSAETAVVERSLEASLAAARGWARGRKRLLALEQAAFRGRAEAAEKDAAELREKHRIIHRLMDRSETRARAAEAEVATLRGVLEAIRDDTEERAIGEVAEAALAAVPPSLPATPKFTGIPTPDTRAMVRAAMPAEAAPDTTYPSRPIMTGACEYAMDHHEPAPHEGCSPKSTWCGCPCHDTVSPDTTEQQKCARCGADCDPARAINIAGAPGLYCGRQCGTIAHYDAEQRRRAAPPSAPTGTVAACPQGCGGSFVLAGDNYCPSCRRHWQTIQVAREGTCFQWFGGMDHRMRCWKKAGHVGGHDTHGWGRMPEETGHETCAALNAEDAACSFDEGHDGKHSWDAPSAPTPATHPWEGGSTTCAHPHYRAFQLAGTDVEECKDCGSIRRAAAPTPADEMTCCAHAVPRSQCLRCGARSAPTPATLTCTGAGCGSTEEVETRPNKRTLCRYCWEHPERYSPATPTPATRTCQWFNLDDQMDGATTAFEGCSETATHTTCSPVNGVCCVKHKCRCSKPLTTAQ